MKTTTTTILAGVAVTIVLGITVASAIAYHSANTPEEHEKEMEQRNKAFCSQFPTKNAVEHVADSKAAEQLPEKRRIEVREGLANAIIMNAPVAIEGDARAYGTALRTGSDPSAAAIDGVDRWVKQNC
jgi:uncharacterized membrane protein